MRMSRRIVFAMCVLGAVTLGLASGSGPSAAGSGSAMASMPKVVGCPMGRTRTVPIASSSAPHGAGLWIAAAGHLVRAGGSTQTMAGSGGADGAMVRHVASLHGIGTAFVEDGPGGDTVVLATQDGIVRLPQRAEAVNPVLSPAGDLAWSVGSEIRVRDAGSGRITRLSVPVQGARAFSPVFVGGGALDVVVSSPPTRAVPEDERLSDVWHVSPEGTWRRATSFDADDDRWTAVRTPVAAPEGGIEFVLVRGRGSATEDPRFLLMHLGRRGLERLQTLDREMYLAGFDGRARLWNVPDIPALRVDLVREGPDGTRLTIGCGTTLMDPIDVVDPDRSVTEEAPVPPPGDAAQGQPHPSTSSELSGSEVGILVGDFPTAGEADVALMAVRAAYGDDAPVRVVSSDTAPHAVRPGAYGVLFALPASEDPQTALAAFRARLPAYVSSSWVVAA
jgi:hypothetical protein